MYLYSWTCIFKLIEWYQKGAEGSFDGYYRLLMAFMLVNIS